MYSSVLPRLTLGHMGGQSCLVYMQLNIIEPGVSIINLHKTGLNMILLKLQGMKMPRRIIHNLDIHWQTHKMCVIMTILQQDPV